LCHFLFLEPHRQPRIQQALQNIKEVDEDVSSSSGHGGILPPVGLSLDRQFVEGDQYSVAIKWGKPHPLPADVIGYNVYVNGEFHEDVAGADNTSVLVTGIPRKQVRCGHQASLRPPLLAHKILINCSYFSLLALPSSSLYYV